MSMTKIPSFVELPDGFAADLRSSLGLAPDEKPRLCYLSLANDVARVQQFWVNGENDPRSQKATFAGMFFDVVKALDGAGLLFSTHPTEPPAGQAVTIANLAHRVGQDHHDIEFGPILERLAQFAPHMVMISPSLPPDIVPEIAVKYPTVYYAHSLFWPSDWDADRRSLKLRVKRFVRMRRARARLKNVKAVMAPSELSLGQFRAVVKRDVPSFICERQFYEEPQTASGRKPSNLLFVGGIDDHSGVADLVTAFSQAKQKLPELNLTLVGDGPKRQHFEKLAEATDGLNFASGFDAIAQQRAVAEAGLLVIPSPAVNSQGGPDYLPEALVCGVPALVSSSVFVTEAEKPACFTYKSENLDDLCAQILKLNNDPVAYRSLRASLPFDSAPYFDRTKSWGSGIAWLAGKLSGVS
jgi:glycosyltransferase involved in cell wall biosynthesis